MRIIINAFQYSASITGTDRMAHNFLTELGKIDSSNQYIVICSSEPYIRSALNASNFRTISPKQLHLGKLPQRIYNKLWRIFLPYRLRLYNADRYLSFHNMSLPEIRVARKMYAFNLDLIPLVLPGYESIHKKSKQELLKDYKDVAANADHLFSISSFSKKELVELLGTSLNKIDVIYLAADPSFESIKEATKNIDHDYIFVIGGSEPRKNVKTVIEAYKQLPEDIQQKYKLVIAGGKWHGQKLDYTANENIIELGYVPDEDLPGLYANSSVFVFASIYEGFGFTILEAMAAGAPVINAKGSSLDEVAGDATLSFEATDSAALAAELKKALGSQKLRAKLTKKGHSQQQKFSWKKSAIKLHQILTDN